MKRIEDAKILRGEAQYLDDIQLPGMAHVAFVRSPRAHAVVSRINATIARRLPGVIEIITADSIHGLLQPLPVRDNNGQPLPQCASHPILADRRVRYVGQPVVAVIAETRVLAEDACELVNVEYLSLPAIVSVREATIAADRVHEAISDNVYLRVNVGGGDVTTAFAKAEAIVRQRFEIPRLVAAPMETRGAIASPTNSNGYLTFWCSAQDVHRPLADLCHVLGREPATIRIVIPQVGGAFGSKGGLPAEAALTAWAALHLERPLKWTESRTENFVAAYQGRGLDADVEVAVTAHGRIRGLRARLYADFGAYVLPDTPYTPFITARLLTSVYAIEAATIEIVGVATTKVPAGPYRGAGRPEAAFITERMIDIAAQQLRMDPIVVRRENFIEAGGFPYVSPVGIITDPGDYLRCLEVLLKRLDSETWREIGRRERRLIGIGVAMFLEDCGGGTEGVTVAINDDGKATVRISVAPQGQGHETAFLQIVADGLGIEPSEIEISWGDSRIAPPGTGTYGSRSISLCGSAALLAARHLHKKFARVERRVGRNRYSDSEESEEVFGEDYLFATGAYGCVLEIDESTGRITILKLIAVDDAGRIVNPLLAEGQVLGAAVQGLGEALCERVIHDREGQPISGSFSDYALLRASDVPVIESVFIETPSTLTPLGTRGIGEAGSIGAPAAVANAVADALAPLGITHVDMPFTNQAIHALLQGRASPIKV
jgi:carbon-monoxide dehydrogenase large subunit